MQRLGDENKFAILKKPKEFQYFSKKKLVKETAIQFEVWCLAGTSTYIYFKFIKSLANIQSKENDKNSEVGISMIWFNFGAVFQIMLWTTEGGERAGSKATKLVSWPSPWSCPDINHGDLDQGTSSVNGEKCLDIFWRWVSMTCLWVRCEMLRV